MVGLVSRGAFTTISQARMAALDAGSWFLGFILAVLSLPSLTSLAAGLEAIQHVKPSVVAIGTFQKTRSPSFSFMGTGFAVGDGSFVTTNAHVVPGIIDKEHREVLVIAVPGSDPTNGAQLREARVVAVDRDYDLAVLRIEGQKLPPLTLGDSSKVREGQGYLFTGYPLGTVLGLFPVTHQGMVSAIAPIAIPSANATQLDARTVKRLSTGAYPILQLDGTAYPGNSGSPLYQTDTGEVIGVINMVFVKGTKESAITHPSGITYAVPIQPLKDLPRMEDRPVLLSYLGKGSLA